MRFSTFVREIEADAKAEGPTAVRELEALRAHYRSARRTAEARLARKATRRPRAKPHTSG